MKLGSISRASFGNEVNLYIVEDASDDQWEIAYDKNTGIVDTVAVSKNLEKRAEELLAEVMCKPNKTYTKLIYDP